MIKFTHVEGFHNIVRTYKTMGDHATIDRYHLHSPVTFRGTVKLHGTNVGVVCTPEGLQPQSRNRALTVEDDNYGFAAFVARPETTKAIRELETEVRGGAELDEKIPLVFWGEHIGPRIQKGVATARLTERQWVLFAVGYRHDGPTVDGDDDSDKHYLDLLPTLDDRFADAGIYSILDAPTWTLTVDFSRIDTLEQQIGDVEGWVESVESRCPWGARFGLEGIGEGIVFTPTGEHQGKSWLFWKAKGEAHKKTKGPKVAVDPAVVASIDEFVDFAVTEGRLEQGLEHLDEMGLERSMKSTGPFLKWVAEDVRRECRDELEEAGLDWKQVAKAVNHKALTFFKKKILTL